MASAELNTTWFTPAEIAELLKISRSNVYQLCEAGLLVAHRIGAGRGCIRIAQEDLNAYLARARRQPARPAAVPPRRRGRRPSAPITFEHLDISQVLSRKTPPARRSRGGRNAPS
jgi:excisionase family DNA binding protein